MLVLSRHPGDEIEIGEGIVVKIVSVQGNKVRVGIEAPRGVGVLRRELRERAPGLRPVPCVDDASLRADALRYRWLRSVAVLDYGLEALVAIYHLDHVRSESEFDSCVDACVDLRMRKEQPDAT